MLTMTIDLGDSVRSTSWPYACPLESTPRRELLRQLEEAGLPGWLNLLVLSCWNALKFLIMGPVSVILLVRALMHETTGRRRMHPQSQAMQSARFQTIGAWAPLTD